MPLNGTPMPPGTTRCHEKPREATTAPSLSTSYCCIRTFLLVTAPASVGRDLAADTIGADSSRTADGRLAPDSLLAEDGLACLVSQLDVYVPVTAFNCLFLFACDVTFSLLDQPCRIATHVFCLHVGTDLFTCVSHRFPCSVLEFTTTVYCSA